MSLETFFRSLPKGAFWITGQLMRELGLELIRDRAVLAQGHGHEVPTATGRVFFPDGGDGSAAGGEPWAIVGGTAAGKVKVATNSTLMQGLAVNSGLAPGGIAAEFALDIGEVLYLEITLNESFAVTGVELKGGDPWTNYPQVYSTTGSGTLESPTRADKVYFLIGQAVDPEAAPDLEGVTVTRGTGDAAVKVKVLRCCWTPLILDFVNVGGGFVVPYPRPHGRPVLAT